MLGTSRIAYGGVRLQVNFVLFMLPGSLPPRLLLADLLARALASNELCSLMLLPLLPAPEKKHHSIGFLDLLVAPFLVKSILMAPDWTALKDVLRDSAGRSWS